MVADNIGDASSQDISNNGIDSVLPGYSGLRKKKGRICPGVHIDGLVQECSNCIAYAPELLQSCTKQLI